MTTETKLQKSIRNWNSKFHHVYGSYFVIMKSQRAGLTIQLLKFTGNTERAGVNKGAQTSQFCPSLSRVSKETNFVGVRLESLCIFSYNSDLDHHLYSVLCWDRVHCETFSYTIFHLKLPGGQGLFRRQAPVCNTSVLFCKQKTACWASLLFLHLEALPKYACLSLMVAYRHFTLCT